MFIDASAIVAVLAREADHQDLLDRIVGSDSPLAVSPLVRLETVLALARLKLSAPKGPFISEDSARKCENLFDMIVDRIGADEIEIDAEMGRAAVAAYARFGKGSGHAAKLNLADCFSYACAKKLGVRLLYKGDDFAKTDIG